MKFIFLNVLGFITFGLSGCGQPVEAENILEAINQDASIGDLQNVCPADLYQGPEITLNHFFEECAANEMACLKRCNKKDANACYSLAYVLEQRAVEKKYFLPFYARACQGGVSSGCTNLASHKDDGGSINPPRCYTRSYALNCQNGDEWGCTMYAFRLYEGKGAAVDKDLALKALEGSCTYGETDPACSAAMSLREAIKSEVD